MIGIYLTYLPCNGDRETAWLRFGFGNTMHANQGANDSPIKLFSPRLKLQTLPYVHLPDAHIHLPCFNSLQSDARSLVLPKLGQFPPKSVLGFAQCAAPDKG